MISTQELREGLVAGKLLKVRLKNNNLGIVRFDNQWIEPDVGYFLFECHTGWAGGVTEAICEQNSSYLSTFLEESEYEWMDEWRYLWDEQ